MIEVLLEQVLDLHRQVMEASGGAERLRDPGALASAVSQPHMTFGGVELYPTLVEKAVALGYSLVMNHAFLDGNKRIGHAAMEELLVLNGYDIDASAEEQEAVILRVATGEMSRKDFFSWVKDRVRPRPPEIS